MEFCLHVEPASDWHGHGKGESQGPVREQGEGWIVPCRFFYSPHSCSLENDLLTLEERCFCEENGYIMVKSLVSEEDIDCFRYRMISCSNPIRFFQTTTNLDCPGLSQDRNISVIKDLLLQLNNRKKVGQCFPGPNIMALHVMLINKPPDSGKEISCHPLPQDSQYFPIRPEECFMCTWTAMEHVDGSNGCLSALPGTHKSSLKESQYPEWQVKLQVGIESSKSSCHPLPQDSQYFPIRPEECFMCTWTAMEHTDGSNGCLSALPGTHKSSLKEHQYPEWQVKLQVGIESACEIK
uniref:phytanoyl-CoA dioxygenase n=1 Tax=Gopherus agassizii TaxID=38772 RepID=A0A452GXF7_9SAUR